MDPVARPGLYRVVNAVNLASGGPTESIVHGETGFLCAPEPLAFATAMRRLLQDRAAAAKMGIATRLHHPSESAQ